MIDEKQRLTLSGEVDSIVFKSETSAYGVIMLDTGDDLESVTGSLADVQAGEMITVEGYYENNAKYCSYIVSKAFFLVYKINKTKIRHIRFLQRASKSFSYNFIQALHQLELRH